MANSGSASGSSCAKAGKAGINDSTTGHKHFSARQYHVAHISPFGIYAGAYIRLDWKIGKIALMSHQLDVNLTVSFLRIWLPGRPVDLETHGLLRRFDRCGSLRADPSIGLAVVISPWLSSACCRRMRWARLKPGSLVGHGVLNPHLCPSAARKDSRDRQGVGFSGIIAVERVKILRHEEGRVPISRPAG